MSLNQVYGLLNVRPFGLVLAEGHLQHDVGRVVSSLQFGRVDDVKLVSGILDALPSTFGLFEPDVTTYVGK